MALISKTLVFCSLMSFLFACSTSVNTTSKKSDSEIEKPQLLPQDSWHQSELDSLTSNLKFSDAIQLSKSQQSDFLDYFNHIDNREIEPHWRLYNYLERFVDKFDYLNETFTASEALAKESGNCMSLALVTTALANLVELEVGYQMINRAPLYYKQGNRVVISNHIRTKIYPAPQEEDESYFYFGKRHLVIDYYKNQLDLPGRDVSNTEFSALYFNNKAADYYLQKDYRKAYQFSFASMSTYSNSAAHINTQALVLNKLGQKQRSLALFETANEFGFSDLNLMTNYRNLLIQNGFKDKADEIQKELIGVIDLNPYKWLDLGRDALKTSEYKLAMNYFKKAEKLAPYLDDVFLMQAKAAFLQGNKKLSKTLLTKALKAPVKANEVKLYEAKLASFESY